MSGPFNYDARTGNFMMVFFSCNETSAVKCGLCKPPYAAINWDSGRMYFKTENCRNLEIHSDHPGVTDIFRFNRVMARARSSPLFWAALRALVDCPRVCVAMQEVARPPVAVRLETLLS